MQADPASKKTWLGGCKN